MGEEIPRRLRRFQRKGEELPEEMLEERLEETVGKEEGEEGLFKERPVKEEKDAKEKAMELALQEVKCFKEKHKRLPKKEEYDQIAENIYTQLKEEEEKERILKKTERLREHISRKEPEEAKRAGIERRPIVKKREVSEILEKIKGLEVKDLFESEEEQKPKAKKGTELEELSELGLGEAEEGELKFEELAPEEKQLCPNCKNATTDIIYCPGCGTAYCKKCAKKIEKFADRVRYYCPKCNEVTEE